jgi:hypothetical protein
MSATKTSEPIPGRLGISNHQYGRELCLRTQGVFAMDAAVGILEFLDSDLGAFVPNTGWKSGFGLEVAKAVPIQWDEVVAELGTDGDEITIRRVSGSASGFEQLSAAIRSLAGGGVESAA